MEWRVEGEVYEIINDINRFIEFFGKYLTVYDCAWLITPTDFVYCVVDFGEQIVEITDNNRDKVYETPVIDTYVKNDIVYIRTLINKEKYINRKEGN